MSAIIASAHVPQLEQPIDVFVLFFMELQMQSRVSVWIARIYSAGTLSDLQAL